EACDFVWRRLQRIARWPIKHIRFAQNWDLRCLSPIRVAGCVQPAQPDIVLNADCLGHMRKRKRPELNTSLLLAVLLLASCTAQAQQLTQYAHTAWRLQEGAFDAPPVSIAQTTDGFLWIGTLNVLIRFYGVWNQQGDILTFSIAPAYYQTIWFR